MNMSHAESLLPLHHTDIRCPVAYGTNCKGSELLVKSKNVKLKTQKFPICLQDQMQSL